MAFSLGWNRESIYLFQIRMIVFCSRASRIRSQKVGAKRDIQFNPTIRSIIQVLLSIMQKK